MARHINETGLTEQQESFCIAYMGEANGCAAEAYRIAYPSSREWSPTSLHPKASAMLAHGKVQARIAQLRRNTAAAAMLSLMRAKQILSELAEAAADSPDMVAKLGPVKIKAIERLAKMEQWDAPEQLQIEQVQFQLNLGARTDDDDDDPDPDEITIACDPPKPSASMSGDAAPLLEDAT